MNDRTTLIHALYNIGAIQFGEFTLKSGAISPIYINLRKIISYPKLLEQISNAIWTKISELSFDLICGVPYTALPIATCLSLNHQIPMVMRRKEKKDYGTKQLIEGVFKANQTCLIVEDIITTGGSILETAADLENEGLIIKQVVALVDRAQGGIKTLEKKFPTNAILTLPQMLETLIHSDLPSDHEKKIIQTLMLEKTIS